MRLAQRDGDLQGRAPVLARAFGFPAGLQAPDDLLDGADSVALGVLGPGQETAEHPPLFAHLRLPELDLAGVGYRVKAPGLADHVELPVRAARWHHPYESPDPVVEGQIADSHQVLVAGRLLVALHLAEYPLDLAPREVEHQRYEVASHVGEAAATVPVHLEDPADVAGVDRLADPAPQEIPVAGGAHRELHLVLAAGGHHGIGLGQTQ